MNLTAKHRRISLSAVVIVLLAVVLVWKLFNVHRYTTPERVIAWDVKSYYAYLPALLVEHDLTLSFLGEDTAYFEHYWPLYTEHGTWVIKTSMGLSMLYAPFFLVAHAVAEPLGFVADGYSPPYAFALIVACLFYVLMGCVFLRRLLLRQYSEPVVAATLAILVLATNLYHYATYEAAYSHGFNFGLICIFLYQSVRWHERQGLWPTLRLGLNLGLIALIRPSNCIVALFFLLYDVYDKESLRRKWKLLIHNVWQLMLMAVSAVAVWTPQLVYWHHQTGHLFYYSYGSAERFFWTHPVLLRGLFGFRKGWLIYTPTMIFALLGMIPLWRKHRRYFWACAVFTAVNVYIILSWWCWWYGGSFGQRSFIDSYGLLALPMAAMLEWIEGRRGWRRTACIIVVCLVAALACFHHDQYRHRAIHYDAMTRRAYFDSFGRRHPSPRFYSLLQDPDYEAAMQGER